MPVFFSTSAAIAGKSVPIIIGIGEPSIEMNLGDSFSAVSAISLTSFSSSPIIASISVSPEMKTMLSEPYQRGSSCVA